MTLSKTVIEEKLPEERTDRVGWAYRVAQEAERAKARFDAWAQDYDRDVEDLLGWKGPQNTLIHVLTHVPKGSRILDAGSGTGLMGALLFQAGYRNLVATDISDKMLEVARTKDVYLSDFQADLNQPLSVSDDSFDCVVSVGVSGYMSPGTIGEFVRVVRPGGVIVYTISDGHYEEN
ncbi:MAG: methyltransferase domain-containing protein, partial [Pseudomonadota bacterium]